jgi:hypothetical protein
MQAVLAGASSSREGTLCCQAIFALLDTLQKWHGDAKAAAQKEQGQSGQAQNGMPRVVQAARPPVPCSCGCLPCCCLLLLLQVHPSVTCFTFCSPAGASGVESGQYLPLGPQWDCIHELLEAMPKQLLAQAASQVGWLGGCFGTGN